MSEEQLKEVEAPEATNEAKEATQELSDIEQKALDMGWRPKEEWDGEEDEFIDAKEYVRRKPLFDKIEHQSKELKEIRRALRDLQGHHAKVAEASYKKAYEDLKVQYKNALTEGDADKVTELTEQMTDMKAAEKVRQSTPVQQAPDPRFLQWVEKNTWYAQDTEMRSTADQVGLAYANAHPDMAPEDVLKYVEGRIRKVFPEKFSNPNRSKPAPVDGGSRTKPIREDDFSLTEDEQRVMRNLVRQGVLTEKQYKEEIKLKRGVGL